jgi:hypothetical protein
LFRGRNKVHGDGQKMRRYSGAKAVADQIEQFAAGISRQPLAATRMALFRARSRKTYWYQDFFSFFPFSMFLK